MRTSLVILLAAFAVAACDSKPVSPSKDNKPATTAEAKAAEAKAAEAKASTKASAKASAEAPTEANPKHFGKAFTLKQSEALASAIGRADSDAAKPAAAKPAASGDANACGSDSAKSKTPDEATSCAGLTKAEGKLVRVSGVVDSVCQKAGCWMVLKDGTAKVRIFTKDHGFFLPKNIAGTKAEVEGTIRAKTLSKKFAKHLAEDKGDDPATVKGPKREYIITATAVALR